MRIFSEFPEVKFALNRELDIWNFLEFFPDKQGVGGIDNQELFIETYPDLKSLIGLPEKERNLQLEKYVEDFYDKFELELEKILYQIAQKWEKVSSFFFSNTEKIFKGLPWPEGKYIGFISISPKFPRFLEEKTFQIPMDQEMGWSQTIAHEMLHFLFFEYVRKRYLPILKNTREDVMTEELVGKFNLPLWELSEAFNVVILNLNVFPDEMREGKGSYPGLSGNIQTLRSVWKESDGDIDTFFSKLEVR